MSDLKKQKVDRTYIYIGVLFCLSVLIRFLLSDYIKVLSVYRDELRYCSIAQSIAEGNGLKIYNIHTDYQKILYSLFLVPAFWTHNIMLRAHIIALINGVLVSSGIFPAYNLARKTIKNNKGVLIVPLIYILLADLTYSCTYMAETVFLPLALLVFERLVDYISEARKDYIISGLALGTLIYLLYLSKEIAAAFVIVSVIELGRRKRIKELCIVLGAFCILFVLGKAVIFGFIGSSYNQQGIEILFEPGRVRYMIYGFVYLIISILIAGMFFFVVNPLVFFNKLNKYAKNECVVVFELIILSAMVIAYTITVRENFEQDIPTSHLRYISYVWIILIILSIHVVEEADSVTLARVCGLVSIWVVFAGGLIYFYKGVDVYTVLAAYPIMYLYPITAAGRYRSFAIIAAILCFILIMIMKYKPKVSLGIVFSIYLMLQLFNQAYIYKDNYAKYNIKGDEYNNAIFVQDFIAKNRESNFLMVGSGIERSIRISDTFFTYDNIYTVFNSFDDTAGEVDLANEQIWVAPLVSTSNAYIKYDLSRIDYLIAGADEEEIDDATMSLEFKNGSFSVYKVLDGEHLFIPQKKSEE